MGSVKPRSYDTSSRRRQAAERRARILVSARELLLEHGYPATTVTAIAERAGVHVDTVYDLVGRKPVLLRELIEQAISGTDGAVPAEERPEVLAIRAEPDAQRKLEIYAAAIRRIHARLAPLLLVVRDAAAVEPEAAEVWQQISERRAQNMRRFVDDLRSTGQLRRGLRTADAADTIWVTNSPEVYAMLTTERGWSPQRYERWLLDTWRRVLLEP